MSGTPSGLLVLLALVGQLLAGALLVPAEAEAAQRASIRAVATLCASAAPSRPPARHHALPDAPAKAVCPLAAHALAAALPAGPAPSARAGTVAHPATFRPAPPPRGPPRIVARKSAPRAPPLET